MDSPTTDSIPASCSRPSPVPGVLARRQHRHASQRTPRPPLDRHRPRQAHGVDQPRPCRRWLRTPRFTRQDRQQQTQHRPRSSNRQCPRRVAALDPARTRCDRRSHRPGVHHRRQPASAPALDLPNVRTDQPQRRATCDPVPRPATHPRHPPHQEGVPVKVVSERLGHATTAFTIETYQHVLPGMQAERRQLVRPAHRFFYRGHPVEGTVEPSKQTVKPWPESFLSRASNGGGGRI